MAEPAESGRPLDRRAGRRAARRVVWTVAAVVAACLGAPASAPAQTESSATLPRFASLKSDEANMRAGPGAQFPLEWVYRPRGPPAQVGAAVHNSRRVPPPDRPEGW